MLMEWSKIFTLHLIFAQLEGISGCEIPNILELPYSTRLSLTKKLFQEIKVFTGFVVG